MKINLKKERGITLIALVITIIVLLILAGVTIASITGENGILSKATQASQKTTQEKEREEIKMAVTSDNMKDITGDERESDDYIENFQKELDNIAGASKTKVVYDMGVLKVTYKETGNEYYIGYDENDNEKIKTREEYLSGQKYETGDLTDDEKTQLESGIKLEINSGSKGEFLVQVRSGGIIDWGDGTYSKVEDPYTGKMKNNKILKIASMNNYGVLDVKKGDMKVSLISAPVPVWHEYSEKNKIYTVKILTNIICANSEALLKIVDWGECELRDVDFSNSTNLTEIASPKEKSFNKDPGIVFRNCTSLKQIPADFFNNISNISNVSSMFENCTSLTGNAIELWNNSNIEYHENCYKGCTNLSNYDQIPEGWK